MPQVAYDGDAARPFLDSAIRARVASWVPISVADAALPLAELARRHPPRMGRMLRETTPPRSRRSA